MTRARILVVLAIGFLLTGGMPPPRGEASAPATHPGIGENTEEVALQRWQSGAARHWRYAMTRH